MKTGKRLEQPIPETITVLVGSMSNSENELYIAASTAKSPQPGHQIGLASVLYSLAGMNGMMMFL
jgi:hypothetical protein